MNPTILGVIGPGFLNQVPTLEFWQSRDSQTVMITKQKTKDHTSAFKQVAIMVTSFPWGWRVKALRCVLCQGAGVDGIVV